MTRNSKDVGDYVMKHGVKDYRAVDARGREQDCKRGRGRVAWEPRGEPVSWAMWVETVAAEEQGIRQPVKRALILRTSCIRMARASGYEEIAFGNCQVEMIVA